MDGVVDARCRPHLQVEPATPGAGSTAGSREAFDNANTGVGTVKVVNRNCEQLTRDPVQSLSMSGA